LITSVPLRPARILIVDDSAVMRALLRSVVASDTRLEVAGTASDGASALRVIDSVQPDLILLDVEMPIMDGLGTLKLLKAKGSRVPVIMCSTLTQRGAKVTIEALAGGASDYVAKPSGQPSREAAVNALAYDLIPKILALTAYAAPPLSVTASHNSPGSGSLSPPAVVVIGVSTGGPAALDLFLPQFSASFPLPVLIVQHMPELFTRHLAERLNSRSVLHVCEATDGEPIRPGNIYIAKGDWHMEVSPQDRNSDRCVTTGHQASAPILRLTKEALENHCRPAVDVLFRSAVAVYGSRVLGVVLTGMGQDGLAGSRIIRENGGTVLAQDQPTSAVWGMPGAIVQAGLANRILPLDAIAPEILRLAVRGQRETRELRQSGSSRIGSVTA
jgi:two-component system, chemotaxis family, protein-glutamate methylesterase/glutaminase